MEENKTHDSTSIQIVAYHSKYQHAFRALNKEWIDAYFKMEAADYQALDHPDEYIINKGGAILVAIYEEQPVGVCALIKLDDHRYDYELAKMAVAPNFQGKKIGYLIGKATIEKAKELNAKVIYLESNTLLKPAINLYRKLGFKEVEGLTSPYERSNIKMELILKEQL